MADGWIRQGSCTHCGFCCAFLGSVLFKLDPVQMRDGEPPDYEFLRLRGTTLETAPDGRELALIRVPILAPCSAFNKDAAPAKEPGCTIYERRPPSCWEFPRTPEQVSGTPCSYWFERHTSEGIERIGGNSSPHPGVTTVPLTIAKR